MSKMLNSPANLASTSFIGQGQAKTLLSGIGAGRARTGASRLDLYVRPDEPGDLSGVRSILCEQLQMWEWSSVSDTAALLASELVANALQYAGGSVLLRALLLGSLVRLEVYDCCATKPLRRQADELATSGRGMMLIEALADSWGTHPSGDGKCVWCEISIESG